MKTYKLSEILGLKGAYARRFNYEITSLESKKPQTRFGADYGKLV